MIIIYVSIMYSRAWNKVPPRINVAPGKFGKKRISVAPFIPYTYGYYLMKSQIRS